MNAVAKGQKPRTRQRTHKPPPAIEVPHIEEDATERKRALNVLAQRRYRTLFVRYTTNALSDPVLGEKKRQSRLKARSVDASGTESAEKDATLCPVSKPLATPLASQDSFLGTTIPLHSSNHGSEAGLEFDLSSWDPLGDVVLSSQIPDTGPLPDFLTNFDLAEDTSDHSSLTAGVDYVEELPRTLDPSCLDLKSTSSSSPSDVRFPDSYHLPVHELTILRAMLRIADRLGCNNQQLWELGCLSPFNSGETVPTNHLPVTWRPTASQITVPHHPVIDFLPWPSVRDRVLMIFSLPEEARPPQAAGPMALVNLVYDLEDNSEGVRIYGGDPYEASSWEVGQVFFERWWFLFDRDIIETSNNWRRLRGAQPLLLKGSSPSSSSGA